ncbi:uncharacterized protein LOC111637254 isoform X3 [Centruroides sculpturatus]|uniref:uncharacterized protein LOC111637254 isoform X3 n=1 Tax=Centruroides sculpturatus TaxID=218467 RepID=UPI000C6E805A|nr:uncharacterized protein LOC111637254 isoform X3 [Centruroides sculpturatus]
MDHSNIGENVSVTPEEEGNGNNSSARNNDVEAYRKSVNAGIYDVIESFKDDKTKSWMERRINTLHRWYYYILAVTSFLAYSVIIPIIKIIAGARCLGKLEGDKYLVPCLIAGGALMLCRTLLDIIIELIKVTYMFIEVEKRFRPDHHIAKSYVICSYLVQ